MSGLTIYGVARSRASRNIWLCEEMGVAYTLKPVVQAYRFADPLAPDAPFNTKSPAFLAVNPSGQIPSIDDDGLILHESLAINLYLARKHGGVVAPANVSEEGLMTMWTIWAVTACEPHAIEILFHRIMRAPELRDPAKAEAAIAALHAPLARLDLALQAGGGWLVGGRFTVADINVAEVLRYAMAAPEAFAHTPAVTAWMSACHARPAFKRMMAMREGEPA
jgi:glutathione S-transferase